MDTKQLQHALILLGWGPRDLVREVNIRLQAAGRARLDPTAGYSWLRGGCPRPPVPGIVAELLSQATGRSYRAEQLWPGAPPVAATATAVADLAGTSLHAGKTLDHVRELAVASTVERAALRPANGHDLLDVVLDGLAQTPVPQALGRGVDRVDPPLMTMIEDRLAALRRLDDTVGGGPLSQRYVGTELANVVHLIRHTRYTSDIGCRLLRAGAGLAQLAGWLSFDAGQAGSAQRHHVLAIQLARAGGDVVTAANSVGMLAYQCAVYGDTAHGRRLAEAAVTLTARSVPAVRARAQGRLATAQAAAGELHAYRVAADTARSLLEQRRIEDVPASLYYLTTEQLGAESGHALLNLAVTRPANTRTLLRDSIAALTPLVAGQQFARSALLHGAHLATAHVRAGDLEAACHVVKDLAAHVPAIHSVRCRALLTRLRSDLGRRRANPWAAEAATTLGRALSTT